jgi:hypothetical protein
MPILGLLPIESKTIICLAKIDIYVNSHISIGSFNYGLKSRDEETSFFYMN